MKALLLALALPLLQASPQAGVDPVDGLRAFELTAEEEARAQDLMREIRCAACENEPISHSSADIAGHMRERVRALVAEGASDEDVRVWFADRYGEFVLFRPEATGLSGWTLWGGPFMLLLLGGLIVWRFARRDREGADIVPVSPEDTAK